MKKLRDALVSGSLVFAVALVLGSGAAVPVQAAKGLVIYLDDDPANNGSAKCPATSYHTLVDAYDAIQAATVFSNITWHICSGEYSAAGGKFVFNNFKNLKIIGKGSPVIVAPSGFQNPLFVIGGSDNVTVQGLSINGGGQLSPSGQSAIIFSDSSGTITGNTISGWHTTYSGLPPFAVTGNPIHSIHANGDGTTAEKLTISNNTVYDSQDTGILVSNYSAVSTPIKVMNNRVVFASAIVPAFAPSGNVPFQAGIALVNSGPGAAITGNEVITDSELFPTNPFYATGIMIFGTPGSKVTGNTVRGAAAQITVMNACNIPGMSSNDNVISGNKLYDSWHLGIYVTARNDFVNGTFDCQAAPHADHITISGNTVYTLKPEGSPYAHYGIYLDTNGGVISNITVKGNTVAGYATQGPNPDAIYVRDQGGLPNAVIGPNKLLTVPSAGVYK